MCVSVCVVVTGGVTACCAGAESSSRLAFGEERAVERAVDVCEKSSMYPARDECAQTCRRRIVACVLCTATHRETIPKRERCG